MTPAVLLHAVTVLQAGNTGRVFKVFTIEGVSNAYEGWIEGVIKLGDGIILHEIDGDHTTWHIAGEHIVSMKLTGQVFQR